MRWLALLLAVHAFAQTALIDRAEEAFRADDLPRAAALASQAIAAQPGLAAGHMILGIVAARQARWAEAGQRFQMVIRLDPSDPNGHFYLGQARLYQKQWAAAAQAFAKALALGFPDRERLLVELAFAENEAGQPARALERLSAVPPPAEPAQYYAVIGFAQAKLGRPGESIDAIAKARDADPANSHYWELLIANLIATDQTIRALREAIQAQSRFPDDADLQYLFALANYYVAESPLSRVALRNLKEADPRGPRVLLVEGMIHRKEGRNDQALTAFQEAARQGVPDAHLLLGIVRKEAGDYVAAEREFLAAERANPSNGQVLLELGKLALTRAQPAAALARFEKAAALMPGSAPVQYQLGLAYTRLGRSEEAERHLNLSRELDRRQAELQK